MRQRLEAFMPPSAIVDSGGGVHPYWFLETPLDLQNGGYDSTRKLLVTLQRTLGSDPNATDPARILRIPGTVNYKYDPPRPVELLGLNDRRRYYCRGTYSPAPVSRRRPRNRGSD